MVAASQGGGREPAVGAYLRVRLEGQPRLVSLQSLEDSAKWGSLLGLKLNENTLARLIGEILG